MCYQQPQRTQGHLQRGRPWGRPGLRLCPRDPSPAARESHVPSPAVGVPCSRCHRVQRCDRERLMSPRPPTQLKQAPHLPPVWTEAAAARPGGAQLTPCSINRSPRLRRHTWLRPRRWELAEEQHQRRLRPLGEQRAALPPRQRPTEPRDYSTGTVSRAETGTAGCAGTATVAGTSITPYIRFHSYPHTVFHVLVPRFT